jgi:hypothetical protein
VKGEEKKNESIERATSFDSKREEQFRYAQEVRERILRKEIEGKDFSTEFKEKLYNYLIMNKGSAFSVKALFERLNEIIKSKKNINEEIVKDSLQALYRGGKINIRSLGGIEFYFIQGLSFYKQKFIAADSDNKSIPSNRRIFVVALFVGLIMVWMSALLGIVGYYLMGDNTFILLVIFFMFLGIAFICIAGSVSGGYSKYRYSQK